MSDGKPTPYAELAGVIGSLPLLLREARRARGLSQRAAATEIGVAFSTVHRIEMGLDCVLSNAVAVLRWLDQMPACPAEHAEPRTAAGHPAHTPGDSQ